MFGMLLAVKKKKIIYYFYRKREKRSSLLLDSLTEAFSLFLDKSILIIAIVPLETITLKWVSIIVFEQSF